MELNCRFLVVAGGDETVGFINRISNTNPSVVLISKRNEISDNTICKAGNIPTNCKGPEPCDCSHIQYIPLNSVVEIILIDESTLHILLYHNPSYPQKQDLFPTNRI